MIATYVVKDSSGNDVRLIRVPEDVDPNSQLQPGETAVRKDSGFVPSVVVETMPPITEEILLAKVDAQREMNQMTVLTAGGAKKYVYNRKASEALDGRTLAASVLNALSLTDKKRRFPFATAESTLTGETISVVLARYESAMNSTSEKISRIEALAQKAKKAIREAPTMAAKIAAANVNWNA